MNQRTTLAEVLRSLAFYVVFYGGSLLYVVSALVVVAFGRRPMMAVALAWSRFHRSCVRQLLGIRIEVTGEIPPEQVFFAVKHESFFEAIDLPNLLGSPVIFAKAELLRIPLWGKAGRTYGLVPVERSEGAKALRAMIGAARANSASGRSLVIFPEGTRVPHGTRPELQAGFAGIYKLLGLPVVPVAVASGPCYHRRWKRRGTIRIVIGEAMPAGLPRAEVEARVHEAINALNAEP